MKVDLLGKSLGRYKIVEVLGEGGMAKVYKGYDERLDRHVAIKVIEVRMFGSEELYKRFKREATALAQLSHPNIVNVHDYGEQEDGLPYLVMEFLGGGTLKDQIGEPMPYHEAAKTLTPIARALSYAHRHGFIHRDIKPANILLTEAGQPMLTDFGIAKKIQDEKSSITRSGMGLGTPDYMAPEQARTKNIDHRVDIYALGVVFFEMITGRKPFIAQTPGAVILKHSQEPFPSPAMFIPGLPPSVELVILKAVEKDPNDRFRNMDTFAAALDKLSHFAAVSVKDLDSEEDISTPELPIHKEEQKKVPGISIVSTAEGAACPNCMSPLPKGVARCPYCNKLLDEITPRDSVPQVPSRYAPPPSVGWNIVIISGNNMGMVTPMGELTQLGRSRDNEIQITDPNASRKHARIIKAGENYQIEDLNSANGTYVNGQRISSPQWLQPGDRIFIGETMLQVELNIDRTVRR